MFLRTLYSTHPIIAAVLQKDIKTVKKYIKKGVDINTTDNSLEFFGHTALTHASRLGDEEMVELILTHKKTKDKVDLKHQTRTGCRNTALHWAARNGHAAIVERLFNACPECLFIQEDEFGYTPLHFAIESGHTNIAEWLLSKSNTEELLKLKDKQGRTALEVAVKSTGNARNTLDICWGELSQVNKSLLNAAKTNSVSLVNEALAKGANINVRDVGTIHGNYTALIHAAQHGYYFVVQTLLEKGADPTARTGFNNLRNTALHWAARNGHTGVATLLVEANPATLYLHEDEFGYTPLHWAAENGHEALCLALIEAGGPILLNEVAKDGFSTPIHLAIHKGHNDLARLLLARLARDELVKHLTMPSEKELAELNEEERLNFFFHFLNIDIKKWSALSTPVLKQVYLKKHYLKKECEFIAHESDGSISRETCHYLLQLAQTAFIHLNEHAATKEKEGPSAAISPSLMEFYSQDRPETAAELRYLPYLDLSYIKTGNKTSGVEPGFKAVLEADILDALFEAYNNDETRWRMLREYHGDVNLFYKDMVTTTFIPEYLFKLDHTNVTNDYKIMPRVEDLKRTSTIQRLYKRNSLVGNIGTQFYKHAKTCTVATTNFSGAIEALANAYAKLCSGMTVQDLSVYRTQHTNGLLKLMLKSKWLYDATTLKPLAGGLHNDNYCVLPLLNEKNGIRFISDGSITHLASFLPLFIIMGDRDAIGSAGQNKMRLLSTLIGIDFGHAWEDIIIDLLNDDFSFHKEKFKNYSIFYDAPRSDMVRGLIRLAILQGMTIDDTVLKSYGEEFYKEMQTIQPFAHAQLFDDHIKVYEELKDEFTGNDEISRQNRLGCEHIISQMKKVKATALETHERFVEKFSSYLSLEKSCIDLVENIEKALAGPENTSLRSPDKQVLLNHLRIIKRDFCLVRDKTPEGQYHFTVKFKDNKSAKNAEATLKKWLESGPYLEFSTLGNSMTFAFPADQIDKLHTIFSADNIKKAYHQNDYSLYHYFQQERDLLQTLKKFSPYGVHLNLRKGEENDYRISIKLSPNCDRDLINLLGFSPNSAHEKQDYYWEFSAQNLPSLLQGLINVLDRTSALDSFQQTSGAKLLS